MPDYFCTGCRVETHTDYLRRDVDDYYWCEKCQPALFQDATRRSVRAATPRKAT